MEQPLDMWLLNTYGIRAMFILIAILIINNIMTQPYNPKNDEHLLVILIAPLIVYGFYCLALISFEDTIAK